MPDTPTIGTILEIDHAYFVGKIVAVWTEGLTSKKSWALAEYTSIHHIQHKAGLHQVLNEDSY